MVSIYVQKIGLCFFDLCIVDNFTRRTKLIQKLERTNRTNQPGWKMNNVDPTWQHGVTPPLPIILWGPGNSGGPRKLDKIIRKARHATPSLIRGRTGVENQNETIRIQNQWCRILSHGPLAKFFAFWNNVTLMEENTPSLFKKVQWRRSDWKTVCICISFSWNINF